MNTSLMIFIVLNIILLIILGMFVYTIIKEYNLLCIEKRVSDYSLTSLVDETEPLFERIYKLFNKIIKKFSLYLNRSEILKKYALKYNKYIEYDNKDKIECIDYISIKFIISIFLGILYCISSLIRFKSIFPILLLVMLIGFFVIDIYLAIYYKKRMKQIENDLLSAIIIMNNAFKSGMNVMQAVDIVKSELSGPIQDEFKKISMDITYGLSLEIVFDRFYKRVGIEDAKYITTSLSLINKTGGNIVKVFNAIEKNFYDKKKIKDEMNSLTSSSKFMFRLLIILPIILVVVVYMLNPNYFMPLFTTFLGRIILILIIILFTLYIIVVKNVMKVDDYG